LQEYDKILIPKIQRDFAQGRKDKKASDIRKNLLSDIFSGKEVKFDFIFGTNENKQFIPLDGQQRLTTLFLLHLYAKKQKQLFHDLDLSKFTYDTRRASREFCEELVNSDWSKFDQKNISENIINCTWFLDYWQYDPTVSSMLTMLDAIHQHPKPNDYSFTALDNIKFYFFDLDEHNLSENLYLKMNARGKPLTALENFKAALDKVLPEDLTTSVFDNLQKQDNNLHGYENFKIKWQYCIDRQWTDFFWQYQENHLIDAPFMRFICSLLSGYWAAYADLNAVELNDDETLKNLLNLKIDANTTYVSFDIFKKIFNDLPNSLTCIAKVLCDGFLCKDIIISNTKPVWNEEDIDIFKVKEDFKNRSIFFASTQYAGIDYESDNFKNWMRFIWNIAENHVSSKEEFIVFCKMIGKLSIHSSDILSFLSTQELEGFKKEISGFASEQVEEEIIKAEFIFKNGDLKNKILEAEKHKLFKGCIRFLFKSSQEINKALFETRYNKAKDMFDKKGVTEQYKNILLPAIVSQFSEWSQLWKIEYDNSADTWRKILKNKSAIPAIRKVLDSQESLKDLFQKQESPFSDIRKLVHEDLYKSNLLCADIVLGCKLNYYDPRYILYPFNAKADRKKYVIGYHRNTLLNELNVESSQKLPKAPFFWGWNVEFSWLSKSFSWTWNDEIIFKENDVEKKISSKEINDVETLKEKLTRLINS